MHIVIRKASIALVCIASHFTLLLAQDQQWEAVRGPLSPPQSYTVGGVVSDGYGQHVVTTSLIEGGPRYAVTHYLFGNNGETIWSHVFDNDYRSTRSSITTFGGTISIVFQDSPSGTTYIRIVQSIDGGATWSNIFSRETPVEADYLDTYADQSGVHIVFSSPSEVYYVRFRPAPFFWTDQVNITGDELPPAMAKQDGHPKCLRTETKWLFLLSRGVVRQYPWPQGMGF